MMNSCENKRSNTEKNADGVGRSKSRWSEGT